MPQMIENTPVGAADEALGAPLRQTQELAGFGLLTLSATHDLNNFLATILGHARLARERGADPHFLEHHLAQIEMGAGRATDLIRQLRLCAGNGKPQTRLLCLNMVVREMLNLLKAVIPKRVKLCVELTPHVPMVSVNATQLRQVIMNLIINASEALPAADGEIRVRTDTAELTGAESTIVGSDHHVRPGRYVFVEVRDNGSGMDEETRGRIFEPFFTTKPAGSGLGLAAVRDFVRRHHGAADLVTAPDRGTRFRVLFRAPDTESSSATDQR